MAVSGRALLSCIVVLVLSTSAGRRIDKKEAKEFEKRAAADRVMAEKRESDRREADRRAAAAAAAASAAAGATAAEEEESAMFSSRYAAALGPIDLATAAMRPALDRFGLPAPIWPALLDHGNVGSDVPAGSLPCNET